MSDPDRNPLFSRRWREPASVFSLVAIPQQHRPEEGLPKERAASARLRKPPPE
jgi:hypothetical protein